MLDDELKKQLLDMKLDDVVRELEGEPPSKPEAQTSEPIKQPKRKKMSPIFFIAGAVGILFSVGFAFYLQPHDAPLVAIEEESQQDEPVEVESVEVGTVEDESVEEESEAEAEEEETLLAIQWAKKINSLDSEVGKGAQILWNMLERREDDLSEIASELTDLLYDNAERQIDLFSQEATLLLSRYQTMHVRYRALISKQIQRLQEMSRESRDPMLSQYLEEYFGALGLETYENRELQGIIFEVRDMLKQEAILHEILTKIENSNSLKEIKRNLMKAKKQLEHLDTAYLSEVFTEMIEIQDALIRSVKTALTRCLQEKNPEDEKVLDEILNESGIDENQKLAIKNSFHE